MSGEKSLLSGEAGQLITKRFLKLCGWEINEHTQYSCSDSEKHKSKNSEGGRRTHNVDGIFSYSNPLQHSETKVLFISAKHTVVKSYQKTSSTKVYEALKDLCQSITCGAVSTEVKDNYIQDFGDKKRTNEGLLVMLSSDEDENLIEISKDKIDGVSTPSADYDAVYLFDNKRVSFIYSIIAKAKQLSENQKYSFVYPDTGYNEEIESLSPSGRILPVEMLKSNVVPILIQKNQKNIVLIFCYEGIEEKYLQRIIWLSHKLCAFASEIVILFPDFDTTKHQNLVTKAKQKFQTSDIITNIDVRKYNYIPFTEIKEEGWDRNFAESTSVTIIPEGKRVELPNELKKNFKEILPFGRMLRPILSSGNIVATELKAFLKHKGIFVPRSNKSIMLPILCNMILSPSELDLIRGTIIKKEEKPKQKVRVSKVTGDISKVRDIIKEINEALVDVAPPKSCIHITTPSFPLDNASNYSLDICLEKSNTSKDLLVGKSQRKGNLRVVVEDKEIRFLIEFSSVDVRKYLDSVCTRISHKLMKQDVIDKPARKIEFQHFKSNADRVNFLVALCSLDYGGTFFSGTIKSIRFCPDPRRKNYPPGIEEYSGSVKNMDINLINKLRLFDNDENKNSVLMSKIVVEYNFKHNGAQGICVGTVHFPSALNGKTPDWGDEMEVTLEVKSKGLFTSKPVNVLQNKLSKELRNAALTKYLGSYDSEPGSAS